jgi:hypothetical protein
MTHYITSRKVAGSSPDVTDFFINLPNPSSHAMALGLIQPLTEMSTRKYFWGIERGWSIRQAT